MNTNKKNLFETMKPSKALAIMAIPTVLSQMVVLLYNLADTWFIGQANNPYMIGASSLALTIFLASTALSNVFGVGGGSLMARLIGEKKNDDARKVASYTVVMALISSLVFSFLVLIGMNPLLKMLGANENTLQYAKQYIITTTVIGAMPNVMTMCMAQLLRNAGYSKESGIGVIFGSVLNIILDPIFMFVLLPKGNEVLGAGLATLISSICSFIYFIVYFHKLKNKTVLSIPNKKEKIEKQYKKSLYSVGIPAAIAIFLFDIITIVTNRIAVSYGDISLAAMGIVLKIERIPINIGLGICLGMVPLVAYNYGAKNMERVKKFFSLTLKANVIFSGISAIIFFLFSSSIVSLFIKNGETILQGMRFLQGRCFALPFMMIGYVITNYMNAIGKGNVSFILALIRHLVLIIPIMLIMNAIWGIDGFTWSEMVADVSNTIVAFIIFWNVNKTSYNCRQ